MSAWGKMSDAGTQTGDSQSEAQQQAKVIRTLIRMKGYPSARTRLLHKSGSSGLSPSKRALRVNYPITPRKKWAKIGPKVDNKGIVILHHHPSPVRVNHKLPEGVKRARTKIDNRGIDIHKWRFSMLNLRDIVDPYEKGSKLGDEIKSSLRQSVQKNLTLNRDFREDEEEEKVEPRKEIAVQVQESGFESKRRFSFASSPTSSLIDIRKTSINEVENRERKISEEFLSDLKRKFELKLKEEEDDDERIISAREKKPSDAFMADLKRKLERKLKDLKRIVSPKSESESEAKSVATEEDFEEEEKVLSRRTSLEDATVSEFGAVTTSDSSRESTANSQHFSSDIKDVEDEVIREEIDEGHGDVEEANDGDCSSPTSSLTSSSTSEEDNTIRERRRNSLLVPPLKEPRKDTLEELIHLNSLDFDETVRKPASTTNSVEDFEAFSASSGSSPSLPTDEDREAAENDLGEKPSSSSSSSVASSKTILESFTPNTPKIVLEDYRHKTDEGYFFQSGEAQVTSLTQEANVNNRDSITDDEEKGGKMQVFSAAVEVEKTSDSTTSTSVENKSSVSTATSFSSSSAEDSQELVENERKAESPDDDFISLDRLSDGRPSYRLPQRSSSQKTRIFDLDAFSSCCDSIRGCFRGGNPKPDLRSVSAALNNDNMRPSRTLSRIVVQEMQILDKF